MFVTCLLIYTIAVACSVDIIRGEEFVNYPRSPFVDRDTRRRRRGAALMKKNAFRVNRDTSPL